VRDHRGAVIRHDDDLQPVSECELFDAAEGGTGFQGVDGRCEHWQGEGEREEQTAAAKA
jgi:hypothetical protein